MRIVTFGSGSSGNCALLSLDGVHLLLDAGLSCKRIREQLALSGLTPEALSGVLITHEHSDHICGLATMVKRHRAPVFAPPLVAAALRRAVPGCAELLRELPLETETPVGPLRISCFPTPHDTPQSVGWRVSGSETFALATDMGTVTEAILRGLTGADAVLIEANHDVERLMYGPYPYPLKRRVRSDHGHLSNADCAALAAKLEASGTRIFILGHLSRENNTPSLALDAVRATLGGTEGLYVAPPFERLTVETRQEARCLQSS